MRDKDMETVIAWLKKQREECVDQTGCEPTITEYRMVLESDDEFNLILQMNCSKDFVIYVDDLLNYLIATHKEA